MMKRLILAAAILALAAAGCANIPARNPIMNLSIGMTKSQVIESMGAPDGMAAKGNYEILKYKITTTYDTFNLQEIKEDYYVRLNSGRVEAYGQEGDFKTDPDRIYEIRQK